MISFIIYEAIFYAVFLIIGMATLGDKKHPTGPLKKPTGPLKKPPTGPLPPPPSGSGSGTPPPSVSGSGSPPTSGSGSGTPPPSGSGTPPIGGGHVPLLPGQINTKGGVSNLLFGTNIANYKLSSFNAAEQANLKKIGIPLLRIGLLDVSGNTFSDTQLSNLVNGCKAAGAEMLAILPHGNAAYSQHCVAFLGQNCNLYEFSNEPDLNGISVTQYTQLWNALIPGLRKINPKAAFIGPVVGVVANLPHWIPAFLQGTKSVPGALPDGISFHDYPCTGHPTQAVCSTKTGNIAKDAANLDAMVKAAIGQSLPICITEWNVDASANLISYAQNQAYVTSWAVAALESMAAAGISMACQFETNGSACCGWLGAAPLGQEIAKYQAGATPPAGGTTVVGGSSAGGLGGVVASVSQTLTSVFGGQGFIPIAGQHITLAPNSDVTAMLIALDEWMLIQNPFTENMTAIPEDTLNLGVTSFTFTDPFSWLEQFGTNLFYDIAAGTLRLTFMLVGTLVLIKVMGEFIDYQALGQAALKAAEFAALA